MNHPSGMMAIYPEHSFSLIDNEPPLRWKRKLGLAPANGLDVVRRAMILAALAWFVPLIWAALNHRLWEGAPGESLLQHFGIHARFLIAVVLLVIAEATVHKGLTRIVTQFTESGVIGAAVRAPGLRGAGRHACDGCNYAADCAADAAGRRAANPAQGYCPEIAQGAGVNDDAYRFTPKFILPTL
jgi:hypothetical protein